MKTTKNGIALFTERRAREIAHEKRSVNSVKARHFSVSYMPEDKGWIVLYTNYQNHAITALLPNGSWKPYGSLMKTMPRGKL